MRSTLFILLLFCSVSSFASSWNIETIDASGIGRYSSLKIDRDGNAHVAYVLDNQRNSLRYGFWDHLLKKWFVMTVTNNASFCSLALDSKQRPYISFVDFGTIIGSKLRYAHWDGKAWKIVAVPLPAETIAYYTSIVLDSHDNPTISFYEYNGPPGTDLRVRMRTVTWDGTSWEVRTIDGDNQSGKFNAMVRDKEGRIHLVYANVNTMTAGTRYAYWNGKAWTLEMVDGKAENAQDNVGYSVCIALDAEGNPHVSYMDYTKPTLKYAARIQGKWHTETVGRVVAVGYPDRNSIVVDKWGTPYISFYDAGRGTLNLAYKNVNRWAVETVDSNASGATSSLQINKGQLYITYADEGSGSLKIAHRPLPVGNPATAISTAAMMQATDKQELTNERH